MNVLAILADAGNSFVRLFTEMNAITAILFILGIVFCAIEMITPGMGFFGISGIVMVIAGIVVRLIYGGDALMFVYMIVIALVLFVVMFLVASRVITKGKLSKTALFSVKPTVSEQKTEGTKDYSEFLHKTAVTTTALRPIGKASFDGVVLDVVARDGFVEQGETVVCVQIEGQRVVVVKQ
ncbi:MAG: NfeD family protein [Candidatus Fimimonas sp.]